MYDVGPADRVGLGGEMQFFSRSPANSMEPSLAKNSNAIMLITPYWSSGTWVFDDPCTGLVREPFVSGVPEILTDLTSSIPNAKKGFRLIFSAQPFPGYQAQFQCARREYDGIWYQADDGREGWLCPALFKYFTEAPESLFVKAEPLGE